MTTATKTRKIAEQPAAETTTEQPVKKQAKEREQRECLCGCGELTYSRFRIGHDAKVKSRLVKAARSGDERAKAELESLGWSKFIDGNGAAERQAEQEANRAERTAQRIAKIDAQIAALQAKRAELVATS